MVAHHGREVKQKFGVKRVHVNFHFNCLNNFNYNMINNLQSFQLDNLSDSKHKYMQSFYNVHNLVTDKNSFSQTTINLRQKNQTKSC